MTANRGRGRSSSSGSRGGSTGGRTGRGGGVLGRGGSSGHSNSTPPPQITTRHESEDDDETEDSDETQPASPEANENSTIALDGEESTARRDPNQLHPKVLWFSHRRVTQENNGVRPDPVQIFERSHSFTAPTGEKVFASQKAKSTLETYKRIVDEDEQQGVVRPVADVFYQAAGGKQKGQVYGLGQSSSMYYPMTASSGIHSTANSEYITEIGELKDRIASQDAKMDEQAKTIEMMQAELMENRILAQQLRDMRMQMDMFSQAMRGCSSSNPSQSHHNPDDPSAGGASTGLAA